MGRLVKYWTLLAADDHPNCDQMSQAMAGSVQCPHADLCGTNTLHKLRGITTPQEGPVSAWLGNLRRVYSQLPDR